MNFIKIDNVDQAADYLFSNLVDAIEYNPHVVWLVSGGSNADIAAKVFKRLQPDELIKLTVLISDERYGEPGHKDSNYQHLKDAGIDFSLVDTTPILYENQISLADTAENYNRVIADIFAEDNFVFGQLGIGSDGHTLGILPDSPPTADPDKYVVSYVGDDFPRITTTFKTLKHLHKVLVFAFGENKQTAILDLENKDLALDEEPAQFFKQLPEVYIINDMIGESI